MEYILKIISVWCRFGFKKTQILFTVSLVWFGIEKCGLVQIFTTCVVIEMLIYSKYCSQQRQQVINKCIRDDTKAAARQSLSCIKNKQKIKHGEERFSVWRMKLLQPAMWHDHDIDFARRLHPAMWHVALES